MGTAIGASEHRKEAWSKVTGEAVYTDDQPAADCLVARLVTSPHGHARILRLDTSQAEATEGVKAVITGDDFPVFCGALMKDRPPLAREVVRYFGEPVALVVAIDEKAAALGAERVRVAYRPLPCVFTAHDALAPGAPILHERLGSYEASVDDVKPVPGTNIACQYTVKKGNLTAGWAQSEVTVTQDFFLPPSDHLAMEIRTARCEISREGTVTITSSSQSPFEVAKQISDSFDIPAGNIRVQVPYVGGGFGGKAPVTVEILAYIASYKMAGRPVRVMLTREEDMVSMPCRMGLSATVKLGATRGGMLKAAELTYYLDNGAYADIGPYMVKAMATDCTGPYNIENISCNACSVYTNHTFVTSYRGYAHESFTFCMERSMDLLAAQCGIDPLELRRKNAIQPGHLSPASVKGTASNLGNLTACLDKLKVIAEWQEGAPRRTGAHTVRATGIACFWKAATPPTDAVSGALVTFNPDGTLNLNTGVVEMGSASQSHLAQMLADRLGITTDEIHVVMEVDTRLSPEHYKTVASFTTYLCGRAVMRAADDILRQIRATAAQAFCCGPEDIVVQNSRVFKQEDPDIYIAFKDIVKGYQSPGGKSMGDPVIGRGGYMLKGLSTLDEQTGQGKTGPAWTVGAQSVEIELDTRDGSYRLIKACTAMDVGCAVNPASMEELIRGGMSMGLSLASREAYHYETDGRMKTPSLRTYKLLHLGEEPEYRVALVETPQADAPYGVRGMSEHGIIGIPAALANAVSAAVGISITTLPITPEAVWQASTGGKA